MFRTIADFADTWKTESGATLKVLRNLTDASLAESVPGARALGGIAWHIVGAIGEMLVHAGLPLANLPDDKTPCPAAAADIAAAYESSAAAVMPALSANWTDAQLDEAVSMYGEQWKRGFILAVLIAHQTHHRGQMTVLMRKAGLPVPGVCGPSREEWAAYGMAAPE
ncbi:MAG: DinB family protein [Acidobacteria bacterium]|nr:DinB family protein [Acidobacteriota bacterium]